MKIVVYKEDDINTLANLINSINISGFDAAKKIVAISQIINSGKVKNYESQEEEKNDTK